MYLIKVFIVFHPICHDTNLNSIMSSNVLSQLSPSIQQQFQKGLYERDLFRWEDINLQKELEHVTSNDLDRWLMEVQNGEVHPKNIVVDDSNINYTTFFKKYPFKFAYMPKDILGMAKFKHCTHKIPTRHFNFMCGNYHTARYKLLELLWKKRLLHTTHWTLYRQSNENEHFDKEFVKYIKNTTPRTFKNNSFYNLLPEELDLGTKEQRFINDYNNTDQWIYENSLISIVVDTFSSKSMTFQSTLSEDLVFTTPKTFKAIKQRRPFIITIGKNGGDLKLLKALGFETFDSVWDESYDEQNYDKRLDYISDLCYNLSNENITDLYNKTVDICEHNYNVLVNTDWVQWYFDVLDKQDE